MKKTALYILFSLLLSCSSMNFKNYWAYSNMPPNKAKFLEPYSYDEIIPALDSILDPIAKEHFKNQDSSIAVIEICQQIGGFFRTNWALNIYNKNYHWPEERQAPPPKEIVGTASLFIFDSIYHPEAMIRIMFQGYYDYLNDKDVNWKSLIKNSQINWPTIDFTDYDSKLPLTIKNIEDSVYSKYRFNQLNIGDTVNILINRKPQLTKKSSDFYYLTGIINYKVDSVENINVKLTNIESEFNQNFMPTENDTLIIGDTITDYHGGWLSRNIEYFNYHKCQEYRKAFNLE